MNTVTVQFLSRSGVLLEKSIPGDPVAALSDLKETIRYAAEGLRAVAADIAEGRSENPRIGNDLEFVSVQGQRRIPVMDAIGAMPEEDAAISVILITEGPRYQALARRRQVRLAPG